MGNWIITTYTQYNKKIKKTFRQNTKIKRWYSSPEHITITFFAILFGLIIIRLLWLQVFQEKKYNTIITNLHYQESLLTATRGDIYVYDK
jgi:cell division protein FtsI/penicillin-binding protein 2